jgi:hypothetical protein
MTMQLGSTFETVSRRTVLETGHNDYTGATVTLVYRTEGWEPAGSLCRDACEAWGAMYELRDGTQGGTWYKSEDDARARFEKMKGN